MTELEKKQADQIIALTEVIQQQSKQIETQNESLKKLLNQVGELTNLLNMKKSEKSSSRRKSGDASCRKSNAQKKKDSDKKQKAPSTNNE